MKTALLEKRRAVFVCGSGNLDKAESQKEPHDNHRAEYRYPVAHILFHFEFFITQNNKQQDHCSKGIDH